MSVGDLSGLAGPTATRPAAGRLWRAPLAAKLAFGFIGLVAFVLIVNGAVNAALSYSQAKRAALEVQSEKARAAAERVGVFLDEIQTELGWTAGVEWGYSKLEQQRYDFIRLLRQTPAITALSFIDGKGREQLAVSRLEPDTVGSGRDFSADPRFLRAVADKIWFGPVEFRRGSEPYMTVALAHVGKAPGVTVADVNLKLVWDVVSAIHVGDKGFAYVVDDKGRLIAHPDLSLVLRDTDFSALPQVAAALGGGGTSAAEVARSLDGSSVLTAHAVAPKTQWTVFVEQPLSEALATAYRSLLRSLALLGLGLALAAVTGVALARRMAAPIRLLQAGAERLGAGDLAQRLDIRTGDEIEALAGGFNRMAARLQESYENLEGKVEARTHDLNEALAQQTATADVLKTISRSAFDLQAVLDTLVASAVRLFGADNGIMYVQRGDAFYVGAAFNKEEFQNIVARLRERPHYPGRFSVGARVLLTGAVEHVPDLREDPEYDPALRAASVGRAVLGVPMKRDGAIVGAIVFVRREPGPFPVRQIEIAQTFADQAVIAIENARLFSEVQAKTHEVGLALERQIATSEILRVISQSPTDARPVFDSIVVAAARLLRCEMAFVMLVEGDSWRNAAAATPEGLQAVVLADKFPVDPALNFPSRAIVAKQMVSLPDWSTLELPEHQLRVQALYDFQSSLHLPFMREDECVGVLTLLSRRAHAFGEAEIAQSQAFRDQALIAMENARLFNETQESLAQQTATADVLKVISRSVFDLDAVLQTLIDTAVRLTRGSRGTIFIRDGDVLFARAFHRNVPTELRDYLAQERWPVDGDSHMARAAREGAVVHVADLSPSQIESDRETRKRAAFGAGLWAPLMREGQAIGVFGVPREQPIPFTDREIDLVRTFADQAVIAIENARLFEEVQAKTRDLEESLAQQTATADVLKVISRSAFDLQTVFDTLVTSAVELVGASSGTLCLRDGDGYRYVANSRAEPEFARFLAEHRPKPGRGSVTARVLLSGGVESVADVRLEPDYLVPAEVNKTLSVLGVPLLRNDSVEGAFVLARPKAGTFSLREIELVQTFADQAVIAIENTRLFDAVQARTKDLQEALQQQTATADVLKVISRSAFDLDAIFQTLVTTAVDLCNASSGTLCVREGDVFRYSGMAGPEASPELQRYLIAHPLSQPTRETAAGRAILSRQTEEIADVLLEEDYAVPFAANRSQARSLLGVPLLGKTEVLGAIVVARAEPGAFPLRHIEILRTFADQAVIAIENSRLFEEVQARTRDLEQSLSDLRKTQDRLVQSEKLASLGQLTAGIAHEIKNPLNFVNNFASLSRELLQELRETLQRLPEDAKPDADDLMGMIDSNLEKVASHGRRADSIVKNMLLHSREGSGERARVNINAMVEEALGLGYHGARAEKPGFNVNLEKDFDPDAGEADIYLQEITRVLLNLISNGLYASAKRQLSEGAAYGPTLKATTRDLGHNVEIRIRDNGTGIPDDVRAKIFNPFFTTKPAGEGTGLGLSLSHDIVVKQHGGTLDIETAPDAFTEFIITLPREGAKS